MSRCGVHLGLSRDLSPSEARALFPLGEIKSRQMQKHGSRLYWWGGVCGGAGAGRTEGRKSEGLGAVVRKESVRGGSTGRGISVCCGPRGAAGCRSGVRILEDTKSRVRAMAKTWNRAARPCRPARPRGRRPGRPHLGKLSGGRGTTRGRDVSTTSPRLASTRMFWIMFSSSASCRLAKAGSLRGTRARVSAPSPPLPPRHAPRSRPPSSALSRGPGALCGFSLNSPPAQQYRAPS